MISVVDKRQRCKTNGGPKYSDGSDEEDEVQEEDVCTWSYASGRLIQKALGALIQILARPENMHS